MSLLGSAGDAAFANLIALQLAAVTADRDRLLDLTEVQDRQIQDLRCELTTARSTPCQS